MAPAARDAGEAVAQARAAGYPVALKILSPDIAHKTEAGGVALGLADDAAVQAACAQVRQSASQAQPDARIDGVMVQKMERGVAEIIVGATRDPVFGPVLTVGLGGVLHDDARRQAVAFEHVAQQQMGVAAGRSVQPGQLRHFPPAAALEHRGMFLRHGDAVAHAA
ncbi:hypothetical protein G6F57_017427 [Rhizopus arrhizus]|nr:hypothetical protein G6F57_017427 [Rhizopus arrhizus]